MARCEHKNFKVSANVTRLTDGGSRVTGYTADIRVVCTECSLPFRFMGLSAGSHYAEPRVSADGLELRAPLEPAHATEIVGIPLVSGRA